jgi:crotonobetainyl-CoA:carnitine CoA-transferase CaiB-like acyl-CoA transferase
VVRPSDILQNPQLRQRGFFEHVDHEVAGTFDVPSLPFQASVAPHGPHSWYNMPAPTLGQHNYEVLAGLLGIGPVQLQALADAGIIGERLARR